LGARRPSAIMARAGARPTEHPAKRGGAVLETRMALSRFVAPFSPRSLRRKCRAYWRVTRSKVRRTPASPKNRGWIAQRGRPSGIARLKMAQRACEVSLAFRMLCYNFVTNSPCGAKTTCQNALKKTLGRGYALAAQKYFCDTGRFWSQP
jgi:hypothetical protein